MERKTNHEARRISGKIGELLTAVELLRHGFSVSWPAVDEGYDLIADDGCGRLARLQVKTAIPNEGGTYNILFARGANSKRKYSKEDIDAFVVTLIYDSGTAFYVIPVTDDPPMKGIFWQPGQHPRYPDKWKTCKYESNRDRWDLLR